MSLLAIIDGDKIIRTVGEGRPVHVGKYWVARAQEDFVIDGTDIVFRKILPDMDTIPEGKYIKEREILLNPDNMPYYKNVYADIVEPTEEEIRAKLPDLYPRQFRDALVDNDISPDSVTEAIKQIPDTKEREKALNAWLFPSMFHRLDPHIDMIAVMFGLTPKDVDDMWIKAVKGDE